MSRGRSHNSTAIDSSNVLKDRFIIASILYILTSFYRDHPISNLCCNNHHPQSSDQTHPSRTKWLDLVDIEKQEHVGSEQE